MVVIRPEIRRRPAMHVPLYIVILEPPADTLMPLQHFRVRLRGKGIPRYILGKDFSLCIDDIPLADRIPQVLPVLVRVHQQLDCLPSHEAVRE